MQTLAVTVLKQFKMRGVYTTRGFAQPGTVVQLPVGYATALMKSGHCAPLSSKPPKQESPDHVERAPRRNTRTRSKPNG